MVFVLTVDGEGVVVANGTDVEEGVADCLVAWIIDCTDTASDSGVSFGARVAIGGGACIVAGIGNACKDGRILWFDASLVGGMNHLVNESRTGWNAMAIPMQEQNPRGPRTTFFIC